MSGRTRGFSRAAVCSGVFTSNIDLAWVSVLGFPFKYGALYISKGKIRKPNIYIYIDLYSFVLIHLYLCIYVVYVSYSAPQNVTCLEV